MNDIPLCEFCGKSHDQVKRMIVSTGRFEDYPLGQKHVMCYECIVLHMRVLASESVAERDELVAILQALELQNSK